MKRKIDYSKVKKEIGKSLKNIGKTTSKFLIDLEEQDKKIEHKINKSMESATRKFS